MVFTDRSKRILKNAEEIARQTTALVYPAHILLAMLQEKNGVCAEHGNVEDKAFAQGRLYTVAHGVK